MATKRKSPKDEFNKKSTIKPKRYPKWKNIFDFGDYADEQAKKQKKLDNPNQP